MPLKSIEYGPCRPLRAAEIRGDVDESSWSADDLCKNRTLPRIAERHCRGACSSDVMLLLAGTVKHVKTAEKSGHGRSHRVEQRFEERVRGKGIVQSDYAAMSVTLGRDNAVTSQRAHDDTHATRRHASECRQVDYGGCSDSCQRYEDARASNCAENRAIHWPRRDPDLSIRNDDDSFPRHRFEQRHQRGIGGEGRINLKKTVAVASYDSTRNKVAG
jgi:hypothetical protein